MHIITSIEKVKDPAYDPKLYSKIWIPEKLQGAYSITHQMFFSEVWEIKVCISVIHSIWEAEEVFIPGAMAREVEAGEHQGNPWGNMKT